MAVATLDSGFHVSGINRCDLSNDRVEWNILSN